MTHCFWFSLAIPIKFNSEFPIQFGSEFLIQFDSVFQFYFTNTTSIWLTVYNLTQIYFFKLTHHIQYNSTDHLQFNLTWLSHLIWHTLHAFFSPFLIRLSYPDSNFLRISCSNILILLFLIYHHCESHHQWVIKKNKGDLLYHIWYLRAIIVILMIPWLRWDVTIQRFHGGYGIYMVQRPHMNLWMVTSL